MCLDMRLSTVALIAMSHAGHTALSVPSPAHLYGDPSLSSALSEFLEVPQTQCLPHLRDFLYMLPKMPCPSVLTCEMVLLFYNQIPFLLFQCKEGKLCLCLITIPGHFCLHKISTQLSKAALRNLYLFFLFPFSFCRTVSSSVRETNFRLVHG